MKGRRVMGDGIFGYGSSRRLALHGYRGVLTHRSGLYCNYLGTRKS